MSANAVSALIVGFTTTSSPLGFLYTPPIDVSGKLYPLNAVSFVPKFEGGIVPNLPMLTR